MFLRIIQPLHTHTAAVPSHVDDSVQWSKIRRCVDSSAQRGPRKSKLKSAPLAPAPSQRQTVQESLPLVQEAGSEWMVVDRGQEDEDTWVVV
jgi:hypothetical protein